MRTLFFTFVIAIPFCSSTVVGQEPLKQVDHDKLIQELETLARSKVGPTVAAAVKSLRAFESVPDSLLRHPAKQALERLQEEAEKWAKPYRVEGVTATFQFDSVGVKHEELVNLHLLQPQSIAFVNIDNFRDYDLRALDSLTTLENLTIQNCKNFRGQGFLRTPAAEFKDPVFEWKWRKGPIVDGPESQKPAQIGIRECKKHRGSRETNRRACQTDEV